MRIKTVAGLAAAGAAALAALVGGVAYATADDEEPVVRIETTGEEPVVGAVQPDTQPREDCPEKNNAPTSETGL